MASTWARIFFGALAATALLAYRNSEWRTASLFGHLAGLWVLGLAGWAVYAVLIYPLVLSPLRHLPGPDGNHWLLGQGLRILAEPSGMPMREWVNEIPNKGIIRYRGLFNHERVLVCGPKALAEVLVTNSYAFPKPDQIRRAIGRILGVGILFAEGDEHKMQRRSMTPAFAFRHVKDLYPVFWRKAKEVTQAMTMSVGEGVAEMEVSSWASRATLDIIGVAGMGTDFGTIKNPENKLASAYAKVFRPSRQAKILAILDLFLPTWLLVNLPIRRNEDINAAADEIKAVCRDLIQKKKQAKLENKEQTDVDILSVALESGGFTDENLVDQLITFLAAGHETTATAMTWAVYLLSRYPEVQTRLRDEIRQRLPSVDSEEEINSLDIDQSPYLNAVCSEVLRYYSPVPLTIREAAYDTTILGEHIPKGTRIVVAAWATNFDTSLWGPTAGSFDPERWLGNKTGGASSNYGDLTFLHGPKSCIGQGFARGEFACLLAAWVGRFEFALANVEEMDEKKLEIRGGVTARPAKGLDVKVRVVSGY